jgi:hypothetical protein
MKIKKHIKNLFLLSLVILLLAFPDIVTAEVNIEVGLVNWNRNFEESLEKSKKENKPALVLFQEVPGCADCQAFGRDVLSQPLVVEAIESEFIPILVYNNRSGKDARLLRRYNEPAWNYQVIRFLDSSGKDIIPRRDRVWTIGDVARRMCRAMEKAGKDTPLYLHGLALEYDNPHLKEVVLAMHCFWQGEMKLGGINGVVKTEAGFLRHREVTRVWYDETLISLRNLVGEAAKVQCADKVYVENQDAAIALKNIEDSSLKIETFNDSEYKKAPVSDQKKQAQGSVFMNLNLTQFQMTKINAFIRIYPGKLEKYLSPRQKAQLEKLTRSRN